MSTSNRAARINKAFKVLKKHYKPVEPPADRSLLEHMLYACCLENATPEAADEAFAKLQESYFDWNEIRVTTVAELSEVMANLPDPAAAAARLKRVLQAVFETHYAFDIEFLKKQNLGKAVQEFEKLDKQNPFAVAYATQAGLGGHVIPLSKSALSALSVVGVVSAAEAQSGRVPGLERTVPKSKGVEFASLLQQLAAEYFANPHDNRVRAILQEIDSDAKERLPKRPAKKGDAAGAETEARGAKPSGGGTAKKKKPDAAPPKKAAKSKKSEERTIKKPEATGSKKTPAAAKKSSPPPKKSTSKSLTKKKPR